MQAQRYPSHNHGRYPSNHRSNYPPSRHNNYPSHRNNYPSNRNNNYRGGNNRGRMSRGEARQEVDRYCRRYRLYNDNQCRGRLRRFDTTLLAQTKKNIFKYFLIIFYFDLNLQWVLRQPVQSTVQGLRNRLLIAAPIGIHLCAERTLRKPNWNELNIQK